ncbi:hypothetical protein SAMN05421747_103232 [Parapedobacter composti]|uniref:Adhesin domain-containing protein n=1 Tax=Parapedobacter composti TaxID=623281 RepID=A0A1I1FXT2_9SPHI|nr:hypothetical protein [Parapedobacter composti]SFC04277.1 hypothetical protein SAMN05421747_103232 [Parapedobacter composti]
MKKQTITTAIILFLCTSAWAQKEYKIAKSSGKLHLNLHGAIIEGYKGNEIIFTSQRAPEEEDERAKGLQALSSSGYRDNTGLGINVTQNGQDIIVNMVGNRSVGDLLKIRVPEQLSLVFSNNQSVFADSLAIKNMKGEIEVSTSYNTVTLENNSGPMSVKALYRDVEARFGNDIKGPISIVSVYGHVDVALPTAVKANLTLSTGYGKLYAANDFDIAVSPPKHTATGTDDSSETATVEIEPRPTRRYTVAGVVPPAAPAAPEPARTITVNWLSHGGNKENIEGTINGGGLDLILKSTYKNVYLRTK